MSAATAIQVEVAKALSTERLSIRLIRARSAFLREPVRRLEKLEKLREWAREFRYSVWTVVRKQTERRERNCPGGYSENGTLAGMKHEDTTLITEIKDARPRGFAVARCGIQSPGMTRLLVKRQAQATAAKPRGGRGNAFYGGVRQPINAYDAVWTCL